MARSAGRSRCRHRDEASVNVEVALDLLLRRVTAIQRLTTGGPQACTKRRIVREAPGTLEHFLIERYVLHVQRGPSLWSVHVRHQAYPLHRVRLLDAHDELVGAAGIRVPNEPPLAHYATGVDVEVFPPRPTIR